MQTKASWFKNTTKKPETFAYQWHLARFYYWAAAQSTQKEQKRLHAKKGWDAAERAKKIAPKSIEGWYWATANLGMYGESIGVIDAMTEGLASVYMKNAEQAIAIDPLYDDGGPYRSLGRFYTKLPWPMKDLKKSISLIEKSIAQNKNRALTLYFYGDAQQQIGDKNGARKSFEAILHLSATGAYAAEIRKYQVLAQKHLKSL